MASAILERVLKQVEALTPDELREVREAIDRLLAQPSSQKPMTKEEELEWEMFRAGLLSEIKPRVTNVERYRKYKPIEVKGKPVSETIIEERR
jgi:hypothetical protein